ncbi:MAG: hypothetical protein [Microviridae sp.]|nr:MAG: hypothetical protein [Microviridae sp.]
MGVTQTLQAFRVRQAIIYVISINGPTRRSSFTGFNPLPHHLLQPPLHLQRSYKPPSRLRRRHQSSHITRAIHNSVVTHPHWL